MKLGIDISQIVYQGSGVGRFTNGLTRAICTYDETNEWHFFFSSFRRNLPKEIENLILKRQFKLHRQDIPPTVLSLLWNDVHFIDVQNMTGRLDWFITSDWTEPPATCKKATIVHDLAYKRYPETVASSIRSTQEKRLRWVSRESKVLFADSESTKKDIQDFLHIPPQHITVIYPGVTISVQSAKLPAILKGKKYILTVGKREPRKNLDRLIQAFNALPSKSVDLVIVGAEGWGKTPNSADGSDHIHFMRYIPDEELSALYKNCLFFIYPSLWEGFGYPVVEAMAYGVPVATSETSSLGEIARDHAVLFDPTDISDITLAMKRLMSNAALRKHLATRGKQHAAKFTWKEYYESMIDVLT